MVTFGSKEALSKAIEKSIAGTLGVSSAAVVVRNLTDCVIVDLSIGSDVAGSNVTAAIQAHLDDPNSPLRTGPLGPYMSKAFVKDATQPTTAATATKTASMGALQKTRRSFWSFLQPFRHVHQRSVQREATIRHGFSQPALSGGPHSVELRVKDQTDEDLPATFQEKLIDELTRAANIAHDSMSVESTSPGVDVDVEVIPSEEGQTAQQMVEAIDAALADPSSSIRTEAEGFLATAVVETRVIPPPASISTHSPPPMSVDVTPTTSPLDNKGTRPSEAASSIGSSSGAPMLLLTSHLPTSPVGVRGRDCRNKRRLKGRLLEGRDSHRQRRHLHRSLRNKTAGKPRPYRPPQMQRDSGPPAPRCSPLQLHKDGLEVYRKARVKPHQARQQQRQHQRQHQPPPPLPLPPLLAHPLRSQSKWPTRCRRRCRPSRSLSQAHSRQPSNSQWRHAHPTRLTKSRRPPPSHRPKTVLRRHLVGVQRHAHRQEWPQWRLHRQQLGQDSRLHMVRWHRPLPLRHRPAGLRLLQAPPLCRLWRQRLLPLRPQLVLPHHRQGPPPTCHRRRRPLVHPPSLPPHRQVVPCHSRSQAARHNPLRVVQQGATGGHGGKPLPPHPSPQQHQ
ncbi:unnamed protein product [Vitrella brassicaformis CCMP3155]|uniref:Uncharacterized protein n=1 Tax=Vitrella brassicaformis (strain CCMP3155) TaxID=1169540 RepID=A0A0G4F3T7_VITBC|nr:unnamed protein product [Vitrella brassicaformis CCMP3155]|eukprot:CEM06368.1 unnamed protein product [Vitrella brassicaformis CCMP3155]